MSYSDDPVYDAELHAQHLYEDDNSKRCFFCEKKILSDTAIKWKDSYVCSNCEDDLKEAVFEDYVYHNEVFLDEE